LRGREEDGRDNGGRMKTITKEDCELMWVWNVGRENPKTTKKYVVATLPNGRCIALSSDGDWFVSWQHCAPVEKEPIKKWVPCEGKEDLPEGFVNGWVHDKYNWLYHLVGARHLERDGRFQNHTFNDMFDLYEWGPTFDGPWQPIGKMVEVEEE
jgi:hypothetical protein